ncbi:MAG: hypothetical protein KC609_18120 [Myxococcales bacterium]|nr:hypothetical protein [Myxococcales bacterium]
MTVRSKAGIALALSWLLISPTTASATPRRPTITKLYQANRSVKMGDRWKTSYARLVALLGPPTRRSEKRPRVYWAAREGDLCVEFGIFRGTSPSGDVVEGISLPNRSTKSGGPELNWKECIESATGILGRFELIGVAFGGKPLPRSPSIVQTFEFQSRGSLVVTTLHNGRRQSIQVGTWSVLAGQLTTRLKAPLTGRIVRDRLAVSFRGELLVLTKGDTTALTLRRRLPVR